MSDTELTEEERETALNARLKALGDSETLNLTDIRKTIKRLSRMERRCNQKINYYEIKLEQVLTQTTQSEKKLIDKALDVFKLRNAFHFRR